MVAVAHTDLPNGIIIVSACLLAVPFVVRRPAAGPTPHEVLPASRFEVFPADFGKYPALKALAYFLSTLHAADGRPVDVPEVLRGQVAGRGEEGGAIWIVGTIVVETIVIGIAVYASVYNTEHALGWDGRALVLNAARYMVPGPVGVLLLAAACAVVLSTGMNYLLSSSSNVMRDIYQGMINPNADPTKMVALQKVFIVVMGLCAFAMIFIPTYLKLKISVLQYAYFAYTMYGVAVTPALFAALTWKRATRQGGVASIVGGAAGHGLLRGRRAAHRPGRHGVGAGTHGLAAMNSTFGADPWGIPSIYPSAIISIGLLVVVSLMTPPPTQGRTREAVPGVRAGRPVARLAAVVG